MTTIRIPAAAAALALLLAACGADTPDESPGVGDVPAEVSAAVDDFASADTAEELEAAASDAAEGFSDMADSLEAKQTGGSSTLTVGDQTWTFDGALCGFDEEENGQEGTEFVLSSIGDGLQFYLSIDSNGHFASINDVENFEDPTVNWEAETDGEFIQVSGKDVSGEASFIDYETMETADGSFEASCP